MIASKMNLCQNVVGRVLRRSVFRSLSTVNEGAIDSATSSSVDVDDAKIKAEDARFEELESKNKRLEVERSEWHDKYLRALAEAENTRSRLHRQINEAKQFGVQSLCKDLLSVADNLGLAIKNVKSEDLERNKPLMDLFTGLETINADLKAVFRRTGLEEILVNSGDSFDPSVHEAVFQVPKGSRDLEPGSVFDVVQKGYILKDRVIRATKVGVVCDD